MSTTPRPVTKPYALKTLAVLIKREGAADPDDFSDHINQLAPAPTAASASWTSGNGKTIQRTASATWQITLGLVQDLDPSGLLRYLLEHEGEQAHLLVTFETDTDPMLAEVTLSPAGFGGTADGSIAATTVTLAVSGPLVWAANAAFPA